MGIFDSIFGGGNIPSPEEFYIDITPAGVNINDKNVTLPTTVSQLKKIFGKPEAKVTKVGVNYYWNELGIMCYVYGTSKAHTLGISMANSDLAKANNSMNKYSGRLTINGCAWEPVMRSGEKTEVFYQIALGNVSVTAEFADFMDDRILATVEISGR